jgi:hypothetical protein
MHPFISDLMNLFEGYQKAYGYYSGDLKSDNGKMLGKRGSVTGEVTVELWEKHVAGAQGLGIIPINENSQVKFAAVDIDQYDLDLVKLVKDIEEKKLPLVLCRTKSGGAHLYLFLTEFHDAGEIQRKMRDIASTLGFGNSEIFPKQTQIKADRGDVGNWINMPYFNASDTRRFAIDAAGKELQAVEFSRYAKTRIISPENFLQIQLKQTEHLIGGPPCLNHLISMGFPPGTRNNGLLNLGVYAKKLNPDNWEKLVQEYNDKFMDPPLEAMEVVGVIKSLQKKEFFYMCKQPPIAQYCNKAKCRACKHGIGAGDLGMPKFGSLTKLLTVPPIWFLELEGGGRMELTTDQLQSQRGFQNRCMEALNIMPIPPKNEVWQEIVSTLLSNVNVVEIPAEATPEGMLKGLLEEFCTSRVQAKNPDEMLLGKPWTSNGFHYFRLKDFLDFLSRKKFDLIRKAHVGLYLKNWKAESKFWNLKGKGTNTYKVEEFKKQEESFETPNQEKKIPY